VSKDPALCDSALTPIGNCPQKFTRKLVAACLVAGALVAAGCGGDEEPADTTPTPTVEAPTDTSATVTTPTKEHTESAPAETAPGSGTGTGTGTSPEDAPGGAGDEEPARTLALFTARGGQIRPRIVRVPAFISVQVELRSADGGDYALRFGSVTVKPGTGHTFDGLRPGESMAGRPVGQGNPVTISATAEPGP
jgi:hypothetical protein